WTGKKPTKRTYEMLQFYFSGWASEEGRRAVRREDHPSDERAPGAVPRGQGGDLCPDIPAAPGNAGSLRGGEMIPQRNGSHLCGHDARKIPRNARAQPAHSLACAVCHILPAGTKISALPASDIQFSPQKGRGKAPHAYLHDVLNRVGTHPASRDD